VQPARGDTHQGLGIFIHATAMFAAMGASEDRLRAPAALRTAPDLPGGR
jgi:hypothetical protein